MNVGMIGNGSPRSAGGLERQVHDCALGLSRLGCSVRVLSISSGQSWLPVDEVLHPFDGAPIQVHRAGASPPVAPEYTYGAPRVPTEAWRQLVPHWCSLLADADMICTFGPAPALAGSEVRERLRFPFVAVLPQVPAQADGLFLDVLGCGADLFVGLSSSTCRRAEERFGLAMVPVRPGLDTDLFRPVAAPEAVLSRYGILRDIPGPLITSPVRLDPDQGLELLIEAFELVVSLRPRATLMITGGDSRHTGSPYADYVTGLVELKELGRRVRFSNGRIEARHMPALYSRSDLSAAAGTGEEIQIGLAESLACGTPVVATRSEGAAEIFAHGTGGLFADRESPVEVARCILSLLDQEERLQRLGQIGREHVCAALSLRSQADRYLELFTSLCTARAAA